MPKIILLALCLVGYLVAGAPAQAGNPFIDNRILTAITGHAGYAEIGDDAFEQTLGRVIFTLVSFIGVLFILLIIYGGYTWMMARGNESEVGKAKRILRDSIIGLVVLTASYSLWIMIEQLIL